MVVSEILRSGIEQARLGYFKDAVAEFSKAISLDPKCAKAFYNRGCAYRDLKNYPAAIEDFSRAIQLDPGFANAYINRGSAFRMVGRLTDALHDLDSAIQLRPEAFKAYGNRGQVCLDLEDYARAIDDFTVVLRQQPKFYKVRLWRGLAYLRQGAHAAVVEHRRQAYHQAIDDFSRVIDGQPTNAEAYNYRAVAYFQLKNGYQATLDINQALAHCPDYPEAYINRGMLRHELGDVQGAIDDYTAVLELNPTLQDQSYNQTLVGLALDSPDAACSDDTPLNLRFRLADLYDRRGLLQAQVGNMAAAIADYTLASAV
jgi:tetratricopeptide (TPR) repeat protein